MRHLDRVLIVLALHMVVAGCVIALPADASFNRVLVGALLCWLALPVFWLAAQLQGLR